MAHINQKPSKFMYNLLHVVPAFVPEKEDVVHSVIEIGRGSINKYELITESGQLKLDRVGYSSLAYPFAYGAIPMTWDEDGDPLDIILTNITEPILAGALVEARVIGIMKFEDGGEVDDKIIAVLSDDKRCDDIQSLDDLSDHFKKEVSHFWEYYKHLKKPGTTVNKGFFDKAEALKVIKECEERYQKDYAPKLD